MARPRAINERVAAGPYRCHFCPAILRDKMAPEAKEWDWVTGYLPTTQHCCPSCQKANGVMWTEIVRRAYHNTKGSRDE